MYTFLDNMSCSDNTGCQNNIFKTCKICANIDYQKNVFNQHILYTHWHGAADCSTLQLTLTNC